MSEGEGRRRREEGEGRRKAVLVERAIVLLWGLKQ
jgi:hypothetical protein